MILFSVELLLENIKHENLSEIHYTRNAKAKFNFHHYTSIELMIPLYSKVMPSVQCDIAKQKAGETNIIYH